VISLRRSVSEFERFEQERKIALECYRSAMQTMAQYAVELHPDLTEPHRGQLRQLADSVAEGTAEILAESKATLRALLRDYRDKASKYLGELRDQLITTTRTLEEILGSVSQTEEDSEARVRTTAARIRETAARPEAAPLRQFLLTAADHIEEGLDQLHKQHQLALAQFHAEIRMLHKRIDSLEASSALDSLTKLFDRKETEEYLESLAPGVSILLARATGLRMAESRFGTETAEELAAAFVKRLRNALPAAALIGRWSLEEFVVLTEVPKAEAMKLAKVISEQLSGSYSCLKDGKTVRPSVTLTVVALETTGHTSAQIRTQMSAFFVGQG
jgi:GGDEF domain-containing protein